MKKLKIIQQEGISLVEVLAVIVITSIIFTLLYGILSNSQSQYIKQKEANQSQQSISYTLKILTKEIRKHPESITIINEKEIIISGVSYQLNGTDLMQDSNILASDIKEFYVNENGDTISIKIVSSSGEEVSTQIVKRG